LDKLIVLKGYIIIGISIVIGAIIISYTINNNLSAKDHCYKVSYESNIERLKKHSDWPNWKQKQKAAEYALDDCDLIQ
tara:strand:- start:1090 stop:1323 length:234 start_codon:yes stop_codon:yes gene_type:complete